ncbi:uroporphyrinogen decarboxylase [Alloscardovia macacae]|uniref:Uroporphyrinogen decarboxylase n=1 Tax=Alloscardovia macacae TaxID=1160091 RepID=A0A1Y2SZM1_9BIFI|nr:uroporphyrinogen decarboxylase family protein [Alloscardovia macacae]OTA29890.1 uroporphyrinogen decarboxylase [Alloscardovia macacae]
MTYTARRQAFYDIAHSTADPEKTPYLVAAWQHIVGHEYGAEEFATAYVDFVKKWDWDWVKINPRAVYYSEAWGSTYDPEHYDGYVIPRKVSDALQHPEDLDHIVRLSIDEENTFHESYEAAKLIREQLQDRGVIQTVFSPLSVLLQLGDLPLYPGDEYATPTTTREEVFSDPARVKTALQNIAETLADYAARLVTPVEQGGAGLDGIFYAVTGTVSHGFFTREQYNEYSKPYDELIIRAIREANPDAVVLLHTCREDSHPDWFADLADVIHWDQFLPGNPQVDEHIGAVPVGGANFTKFAGDDRVDVEGVREQLAETIAARKGHPFLLAPSCTVPTPATDAALEELTKVQRVK